MPMPPTRPTPMIHQRLTPPSSSSEALSWSSLSFLPSAGAVEASEDVAAGPVAPSCFTRSAPPKARGSVPVAFAAKISCAYAAGPLFAAQVPAFFSSQASGFSASAVRPAAPSATTASAVLP